MQGRETAQFGMCSAASRLRLKPFHKHEAESESKHCAAQRCKMDLGDDSLVDISRGNISCSPRRRRSLADTILKGTDS